MWTAQHTLPKDFTSFIVSLGDARYSQASDKNIEGHFGHLHVTTPDSVPTPLT
jgi:hypothetical protein